MFLPVILCYNAAVRVSYLKFQTLVYHLAPGIPEIISNSSEAGTTPNVTTPSHPYFIRYFTVHTTVAMDENWPYLYFFQESCAIGDTTCSLDGHYQPEMANVGEFFGFSEFYYTSSDCLGIAGRWNLDLFQKESAAYCATDWLTLKSNLAAGKYKADENRLRQQCFKSAWVPVCFWPILAKAINPSFTLF